jgi:hypothetical protein
VSAHVRRNSRDPFSMLDHFLVCNDGDEEKAKEALAQQQTWAKARRTIAAATECDEGETNAIALLAEFATKAPA